MSSSQLDNSPKNFEEYNPQTKNATTVAKFPLFDPQLPIPMNLEGGGWTGGQNYTFGNTRPVCMLKVRPLFVHERLACKKQKIEVLDIESLIFNTTEGDEQDDLMNLTKEKLFRIDRAFPPEFPNNLLATAELDQLLDSLFKGISSAMIAIGAQNSGKTHSMFGTIGDPGFLLNFAQRLFIKKNFYQGSTITISMSMMKVQDDFYDLLCPTGEPLQFKHTRYGAVMPGVSSIRIDSLKEFFVFFRLGLKQFYGRDIHKETVFASDPPAERGHAVIKFKIVRKTFERIVKRKADDSESTQDKKIEQMVFESEMTFIDCDHYELNEKMEYKAIQQSLLTFENILQYVYEINKGFRNPSFHLPFEESKFTSYFKNFLFGSNQLILVGTLSPFRDDIEQSMKTARLVQWAFNSRNSVKPKVTVGLTAFNKISSKEVPFVYKQYQNANTLGEDIKLYLNGNQLRPEDKVNYLNIITQIIQDQKQILIKNLRLINSFLSIREDVKFINNYFQKYFMLFQFIKIRMEGLRAQYEAVKYCIKNNDIKELYLVKSLPQLPQDLFLTIKALREQIAKKIREINFFFKTFKEVKDSFKELIYKQQDEIKLSLKPHHYLSMVEISSANLEYLRWSQENAIRSFEAFEPKRMNTWMEENTSKIFSFIGHLLRHLDPQFQNSEQNKANEFKKIPTDIARRSLQSIIYTSQSDFKLVSPISIISQDEDNKKNQNYFSNDNHNLYTPLPITVPSSAAKEALKTFLNIMQNSRDKVKSELKLPLAKQEEDEELRNENHIQKSKQPIYQKSASIGASKSMFFKNDEKLKFHQIKWSDHNLNQKPSLGDIPADPLLSEFNYSMLSSKMNVGSQNVDSKQIDKDFYKLQSSLNSLNEDNENSSNDEDDDSINDGEEYFYKSKNTQPIKYSIQDLQRINLEIQEKKSKLKQDHLRIQQEAEEEVKRFKDIEEEEQKQNNSQQNNLNLTATTLPQTKSTYDQLNSSKQFHNRIFSQNFNTTTNVNNNDSRQLFHSNLKSKKGPSMEMKLSKTKELTLRRKYILDEKPQLKENNVQNISSSLNFLNKMVTRNSIALKVKTAPENFDDEDLHNKYNLLRSTKAKGGISFNSFSSLQPKVKNVLSLTCEKFPIIQVQSQRKSLNDQEKSLKGKKSNSSSCFSNHTLATAVAAPNNSQRKIIDSKTINKLKHQTKMIQGDIKQLLFQFKFN